MRIAILGYGKEGKSAKSYFQKQGHSIQIFDNFTPAEIAKEDFSSFDLILRSPSLQPQAGWSSMTQYFFDHCPCQIIGVTGTKGKGTTCSIIATILEALNHKIWLVGNIGTPALDVLDQIQPNDIVVYEMSSFQLWDLKKSPHVATVLRIESDHLNVHKDYNDYVSAKANIVKHQTAQDFCIYNQNNTDSTAIAMQSAGTKIPYPTPNKSTLLNDVLNALNLPGAHNRENAEAALRTVAAYLRQDLEDLLTQNAKIIKGTLRNFHGLPHRLQFLRELNGVKYYDDNFCTNTASLEVALKAFPDTPIVLITGGCDKTANADLPIIIDLAQKNATKIVLIGESGHDIIKLLPPHSDQFVLAESLQEAVNIAKTAAEELASKQSAIVLMSPAAASFDMFQNVYDRATQFQKLIKSL